MKTAFDSFVLRISICVLAIMNFSSTLSNAQKPAPAANELPLTVAEFSDYLSTSKSSEVRKFIDDCDEQARHVTKFEFGKTVEGREMVGVFVANEFYELGEQDHRNIVLLLGNIHSGECTGKEALLMLLRELTHNPDHPWLDQNVIVFVPNYNADANDRMGLLNRPGQLGPANGMGRRENAQELDLNRDFGKLETPEARALVALIDRINPHVFVDCHTTNGSKHQYSLTYDIPHNPATALPIREFLRLRMMPAITNQLAKQGLNTFYYGNFDSEHTQWVSFGHEPRYSTEYVGLRGRLAILSEDYSYLNYRDRIFATKDFVSAILDYATQNVVAIHDLLNDVDSDLVQLAAAQPSRIEVSLAAKPTAFAKKFIIKGYQGDLPQDFECDFVANYVSTKASPLPYAYIIPKEFSRVANRLKMHGVKIKRIISPKITDVEIDTISDFVRQPFPFQRHHLIRADVTRKLVQRSIEYGSYVIQTDQPLGRLSSYLLESESDDGFVCWNFFDEKLEKGAEYPVWRLPEPVELDVEAAAFIDPRERIDLRMIDGSSSFLSSLPTAPTWLGKTNLLKIEINASETLIDPRTASFVERPVQPYGSQQLQQALVESAVTNNVAVELATTNPLVAENGKYVVVSNSQRSFVYFVEQGSGPEALLELGRREPQPSARLENANTQAKCLAPGELFDFNYDETKLAYVSSDGLHVLDLASRTEQIVAATDVHNLIGKLDWVYQEELYGRGNFKGFWWNPVGNQLAFLALDESPVIPFAVMDHLPILGKLETTNYPKAGDPLPTVKLGIVDADQSEKVQWVDLTSYGNDDFLISRVTWSGNGNLLLTQVQNREQTWLDLVATDRVASALKVLFRDETPAWIMSPGDPAFVSPTEFLWLSPRDGFNRIYKYNLNGDLLATLTTDDWEVRQLLGVDPQQQFAYFTGSENGVDLHCYRIDLTSTQVTKLTQEKGTHQVEFSHDYSLFLDQFSTAARPAESRVCLNTGELLHRLNVGSDDRLDEMEIIAPELITIQADDGTQLDAILFKPADFSPATQFPVLLHVYGGPQTPRVRNRFDGANYLWHQMLAQQGYVVLILDNRSASYRSTKNAWPIHKQLASNELADIDTGIKWMKQQPWVDGNRIGIWGWSYGGYMTLCAMTHSNAFKVGIAGAPVTDWKNYDAIYTERYMGLPQDNSDGYASAAVVDKAHQLHGRLLLIHGTIDDNVHLNNSIQFAKALQDAGKQFEMMLYPNSRHSVKDEKQAAHLRQLMTDFILRNL